MTTSKHPYMESDDEYSEDGKRKGEDIDETFKKSRKIMRTPKKENSSEDKIEQMMNLLKDLTTDIKDIKTEQYRNNQNVNALQMEIKELRRELKEQNQEMNSLKEINKKAMSEIDELKLEMFKNKETMERLEREKRRKNIVIQGLDIKTNDEEKMKEEVKQFLNKELGTELEVNRARKIGSRTCIIELDSLENKNKVMKNKGKLRNLGKKIYINDDMNKQEREIQKEIRNRAKDERKTGKVVKLGFQKMIVNNEEWIWNKIKGQLERKIKPTELSRKQISRNSKNQ